jgi:hypothetical protein
LLKPLSNAGLKKYQKMGSTPILRSDLKGSNENSLFEMKLKHFTSPNEQALFYMNFKSGYKEQF